MDSGERIGDVGRTQQLFGVGPAGILGRARDDGVIACGQNRLGQLVTPQRPEPPIARQEAVQECRSGSVDTHDKDRPLDLLPFDLWVLLPFADERRVVAQGAG